MERFIVLRLLALILLADEGCAFAQQVFTVPFDHESVLNGSSMSDAVARIINAPDGGRCLAVSFSGRAGSAACFSPAASVGTTRWQRFARFEAEVSTDDADLHLEVGFSGANAPMMSIALRPGAWQTVTVPLAPQHAAVSLGERPILLRVQGVLHASTVRIRRFTVREDPAEFVADMAGFCRETAARWISAPILTAEQSACISALDRFASQEPDLLGSISQPDSAALTRMYASSEAAAEAASRLSPRHWTSYCALRDSARKAAAAAALERPHPDYGVGIESSMRKVFLEDGPFRGAYGTQVRIALARNERQSFQVVVFANDHDLEGVRLKPGQLRTAAGDIIDGSSVSIAPVGSVRMKQRQREAYDLGGAEWWPDPLLTFMDAIDVGKGRAQSFWVTVRTSRTTKPGLYEGIITVQPRNSHESSVHVVVEVRRFALPDRFSLQTATFLYRGSLECVYCTHRSMVPGWNADGLGTVNGRGIIQSAAKVPSELLDRYRQMLVDYGLFPTQIYAPQMDDVPFWAGCGDRNQCGLVNLPHGVLAGTQCYFGRNPRNPQQFIEEARASVAALKGKGLLPSAILYDFDEWPSARYREILPFLVPFKREFPEIPFMMTSDANPFADSSPIKDLVDIWVRPGGCDPASADALLRRGKQEWFYVCLFPSHPNLFIPNPLIEARALVGAGAYRMHAQGFLYWAADAWYQIDQPITGGPLTNFDTISMTQPGDGSLLCPGPAGPLPTIRLENLRDGLEDFEYYRLLAERAAKAGTSDPDAVARANAALKIAWDPYRDDPEAYMRQRELVAALIDELQDKGN